MTGPDALPSVLLPYQIALLEATAAHQVTICEKSRRVGATWGIAADAVLTAGAERSSGGMDVFYLGYNLDMTREFVDVCAEWARAFLSAAVEVQEFLFHDQQQGGEDRYIKAFRIDFASGFEIVALCSRPRSLRGRQGYVIIDEAAFHDDLDELLKAAMALLIWGGKVAILSTHDGVENKFNELVEDVRAGRKKKDGTDWGLVRITFDDAVQQGLFRRICLKKGTEWSPEAEAQWVSDIRNHYGEAGAEELDCIPRASGGKYLSRALLESRAAETSKVIRWSLPDGFVDLSEDERVTRVREFCETELAPYVRSLPGECRTFFGQDFGRSGDLSVIWPLVLRADLTRWTPFTLELRNVPFTSQQQIVFWLADHLPRFSGAAFDARGNGQYLAEVARQRYGSQCIGEVMLSESWYREHMPKLRAAFEDGTIIIPRDAETIDDFRAVEVIRGVARIGEKRTKGSTGQRHGDAAIAAALAYFATTTLDAGPLEFASEGQFESAGAFAGEHGGRGFAGWN